MPHFKAEVLLKIDHKGIFYLIKFKWRSRNLFKVPKLPIKSIILKIRKIIKVILFKHKKLYREKFSVNIIGDYWVNKNCYFYRQNGQKVGRQIFVEKWPCANVRVKSYVLCTIDVTNFLSHFLLNSYFSGAKTFL